jgi:hypothetical protein
MGKRPERCGLLARAISLGLACRGVLVVLLFDSGGWKKEALFTKTKVYNIWDHAVPASFA